jgi:hypothetical protein
MSMQPQRRGRGTVMHIIRQNHNNVITLKLLHVSALQSHHVSCHCALPDDGPVPPPQATTCPLWTSWSPLPVEVEV